MIKLIVDLIEDLVKSKFFGGYIALSVLCIVIIGYFEWLYFDKIKYKIQANENKELKNKCDLLQSDLDNLQKKYDDLKKKANIQYIMNEITNLNDSDNEDEALHSFSE